MSFALKVFCGSSNLPLARAIGRELAALDRRKKKKRAFDGRVPCITSAFQDGERCAQVPGNIRRNDVFLVQSTHQPDSNLMELLVMVDAAKRASAGEITAIIPYLGYARQDRKVRPRVPITARLVANLLECAGVKRVLAVDLHAGQIQGFFNVPMDNLEVLPVLIRALWKDERVNFREAVFVSPDKSGVDRCVEMGKLVHCDNVTLVHKTRLAPGVARVHGVENATLVRRRTCVVLDDMVDGGGTIVKATDALLAAGAARVFGLIAHPVFSTNVETGERAVNLIARSHLTRLYVSDTIPIPPPIPERIRIISAAPLLARAIAAIHHGDSVHELFPRSARAVLR